MNAYPPKCPLAKYEVSFITFDGKKYNNYTVFANDEALAKMYCINHLNAKNIFLIVKLADAEI